VTCAFGDGIPAPARSVEYGGAWRTADCGLGNAATRRRWQQFFEQAPERSDRGWYFALGECIAHLNCLLHAGRGRRQADAGGVLRFIATSTPEHS